MRQGALILQAGLNEHSPVPDVLLQREFVDLGPRLPVEKVVLCFEVLSLPVNDVKELVNQGAHHVVEVNGVGVGVKSSTVVFSPTALVNHNDLHFQAADVRGFCVPKNVVGKNDVVFSVARVNTVFNVKGQTTGLHLVRDSNLRRTNATCAQEQQKCRENARHGYGIP